MPFNRGIGELLSLLYHNRAVVETLFGHKTTIHKNELFSIQDFTEEKLDRLKALNLLEENNNHVSLNDRLITFFEDFLEIGEVNTGFINDNLEWLNQYIKFYREVNNPKFLRDIKLTLRKINSTMMREVVKLHKLVDDTYKNENNFSIKMQRLESFKDKRENIITLIKQMEGILESNKGFFALSSDNELDNILRNVRIGLRDNKDFLGEIQSKIIEFINKALKQENFYLHVQRLKELKDSAELKFITNFVDVCNEQTTITFSKKPVLKPRIAVEFLYTDEGYALSERVSRKLKTLLETRQIPIKTFADIPQDIAPVPVKKLNVKSLVKKFSESEAELFSFVREFHFPQEVGEYDFEKRLSLFIEIALGYKTELTFTDEMNSVPFELSNGKRGRLSYPVVHSKQRFHEFTEADSGNIYSTK